MDFYAKDLGKAINGLIHIPEVVIEHLWYDGCKKPPDENLKENYAKDNIEAAKQVFEEWKSFEKPIALQKIKEIRDHE